uniref:Uncharacterized protein n=1 Tax=Fagus sylvatica TaxID=28930 RepID=A0A2N9HFH9_FAGSY
MGMGLAVCAVAGVLGGLAVAEGVDYVEDKIAGLRFAIVVVWVGVCGFLVVVVVGLHLWVGGCGFAVCDVWVCVLGGCGGLQFAVVPWLLLAWDGWEFWVATVVASVGRLGVLGSHGGYRCGSAG